VRPMIASSLFGMYRYIGYRKPYATSHVSLDSDLAFQDEVRNAARALAEAVTKRRDGQRDPIGTQLEQPRRK